MGEGPALLLVRGRLAGWGLGLLASALLTGCHSQPERQAGSVDPTAYDACYLWPGVRPAGNIRPKTLYLLDGEVRRGGTARFERLRMGVPRLPGKTIWLVVRAERLDWNDTVNAAIFNDLRRWKEAGNDIVGLQLDFDAATRGIKGYAKFLQKVRQGLPREWRLSITGLMDWSAHGDPQALTNLAKTVDEVVVQTYQGRSTIPGYEDYFRRMKNFPIPFRVALVEGGSWRALLNFRPGPALRHELAHGKMGWNAFFADEAISACWLVYLLTVMPILRYWDSHVAPAIDAMTSSGEI